MIDSRETDSNTETAEADNEGIYLYNPWPGFINLIRVKQVKVAKEKRAKREKESKENRTIADLKRWI